jgi:hypothetical protein
MHYIQYYDEKGQRFLGSETNDPGARGEKPLFILTYPGAVHIIKKNR